MSLKHAPVCEMERPVKTGHRKPHDNHFMDRKALRQDISLARLLGIPDDSKPVRRAPARKPYHNTVCPQNEWRYFTILARWQGQETLFTNEYCQSIRSARSRIIRDYEDVVILEIRQQPFRFVADTVADLWWDRKYN